MKKFIFIAFFSFLGPKSCLSQIIAYQTSHYPIAFASYLSRISLANELMESASMGSVIFPTTFSYSAVFFLTTF